MSVQLISYINLICASVSCWVLLWLILKSVPMRRPLLYFIPVSYTHLTLPTKA